MSTPLVGWSATMSREARLLSRATTTFCWFPPERVRAATAASAGRTSYSWIFFSASEARTL